MIRFLVILSLLGGLWACNSPSQEQSPEKLTPIQKMPEIPANNRLSTLRMDSLQEFSWMNPPDQYRWEDSALYITAPKGSDFFNNPENGEISASAPYLFQEVSGDFVLTACLEPDFQDKWNAGCLFLRQDSSHWIKFAFENSDATGPSIVTVVTREVSDDANGAVLADTELIWLRMIKKDNLYSMLWSRDGQNFTMARLAALPEKDTVQVGLEVQCPVGAKAEHKILYYYLEKKRVADLRKGV